MKELFTFGPRRVHKIKGNYIYNYSNIDSASTKLKFRGENNVVVVADGAEIKNSIFDFRASNAVIYIGTSFLRAYILLGHGVSISIGKGSTFTNTCNITAAEGHDICIGEDCMIAEEVYITNTDGHPVFDKSGHRINSGKSIYIGDHVWIGRGAEILKGVKVHSGSIVGAKTVVTKDIPSNSVSVGNPNRILRNDVSFGRYTVVTLPEERYQEIEPPKMYAENCLGDAALLQQLEQLKMKILAS
ncbi:hypothetical protein PFAS1_20005 [Pseudomonas frederiksbergensis]|uniref:acyltransferase n=1 Tax=Pseudomonas frederiksbergensis TaxID=104087 RepID=UPI0009586292|nr:acyltransferase [Pseudomonas frederiksbergensis]APV41531.1 hypothetical protein PFAS1_20005 [Pseudomonas frederiksbergensis]